MTTRYTYIKGVEFERMANRVLFKAGKPEGMSDARWNAIVKYVTRWVTGSV